MCESLEYRVHDRGIFGCRLEGQPLLVPRLTVGLQHTRTHTLGNRLASNNVLRQQVGIDDDCIEHGSQVLQVFTAWLSNSILDISNAAAAPYKPGCTKKHHTAKHRVLPHAYLQQISYTTPLGCAASQNGVQGSDAGDKCAAPA